MRYVGCAILSLCLACVPARAERVVRLTSGEWAPYMSQQLPGYGVASRIVSAAFALRGIKVEYGFFPWPRSLALAKTAEWNGSLIWVRTAERTRDFDFSDPVVDLSSVFFHLKTLRFKWTTLDDLAAYRIGVTNGYSYGPGFADAVKAGKLRVEVVPSDELNFRKLLKGRIDLFLDNRLAGQALLAKIFTPEEAARIVVGSDYVGTRPLGLMLNRRLAQNKELMNEFNAGLKRLRESGELDRILSDTGDKVSPPTLQ
ncbi:MAG: transporter substrate-binding domain-containing protein [Pseudomonadota bacterium]